MAASATSHAERSKIDLLVSEFFAKALHVILDSRIPSIFQNNPDESPVGASASSPVSRASNRWFNLDLGNCPAVQESLESWRKGSSESMVVDILLQQPMGGGDLPSPSGGCPRVCKGGSPSNCNSSGESWSGEGDYCSSPSGPSRTLLERWVVQYERKKKGGSTTASAAGKAFTSYGEGPGSGRAGEGFGGGGGGGGGGGSSLGTRSSVGGGPPPPFPSTHTVDGPVVYKRTMIMLRSLYCTARMLPAHRLFKLVNLSPHSRSFTLFYRVSSAPLPVSEFDEAANETCILTPVETLWGRMCVSVSYRHTTAVTALEITPPLLPRIISDYVGSPTTDPLRRFPSVGSVPSGGISGRRGVHVVSVPSSLPSSPSGGSFGRRNSWSGGLGKVQVTPAAAASPSFRSSRSPSPSYPSEFNRSPPLPPSPYSFSPSAFAPSHMSPHASPSRPSSTIKSNPQPGSSQQTGSRITSQPIPIFEGGRSPPFSASPSPSPPTPHSYSHDAGFSRALRSAPVSIPRPSSAPRPSFGGSPRLMIQDGGTHQQHHSRSPYPPPSQTRAGDTLPRALSSNSRLWTGQVPNIYIPSLEGKMAPPLLTISNLAESSLLISPPHPYHGNQVGGDENIEEGPPSGVKRSLYGPPRLTMGGRGLNRSEAHDEDDEDFSCPFAVSDDEAVEYRSRVDSPGARAKQSSDAFEPVRQSHQRSQDAAVGALVRILKSAPPLRNWSSSPPLHSRSPPLQQPALPSVSTGHAGFLLTGKLKGSPPRPGSSKARSGNTSLVGSPAAHSQGGKVGSPGVHTLSAKVGSPSAPILGVRVASKTSGYALEELRGYIEMRDHLLRQGGGRLGSSPAKPT